MKFCCLETRKRFCLWSKTFLLPRNKFALETYFSLYTFSHVTGAVKHFVCFPIFKPSRKHNSDKRIYHLKFSGVSRALIRRLFSYIKDKLKLMLFYQEQCELMKRNKTFHRFHNECANLTTF